MARGLGNTLSHAEWRLAGGRSLALDRARLLAILNITPDSFSDGGRYLDPPAALDHAQRLAQQGADMLDIGAESTRPGAAGVPDEEQIARAVPVIERIRASSGPASRLPISIDTTSPTVARAALEAGADAVNDQSAGMGDNPDPSAATSPMFQLVARRSAGIILMHRLRAPAADQYSHQYASTPDYGEAGVIAHVRSFLAQRAAEAVRAGVATDAIVLDPGLGFGKSVEQNWALYRDLPTLQSLGYPVLCALSRKSFIGAAMVGLGAEMPEPQQRVAASVGAACALFLQGVRLFRVHDVAEHRGAFAAAAGLRHGPG